ncbi:MAG TPA: sigma-70 family RNA polymerase sigma factor [Pirellulales bacterium]|nr:sigma-70 family RNA polymerase sigma factor [Pirellulales bacterium]
MTPADSPLLELRRGQFATTQWSMVLAAADRASPRRERALGELCNIYWYPLYAFARRQGRSPAEAEDLTQEFFLRLLEKSYLKAAGAERGRFRTFLLLCFKRFMANEHDRAAAAKRGGERPILPLDLSAAETRYQHEPAHATTPERVFERRWALVLLDQVLARLGEEYRRAGKEKLFEQLKFCLVAESESASYGEIAVRLGLSEGAVKVAAHRMRQRYGRLLTAEVARTLECPADATDEIQQLFAALRAP